MENIFEMKLTELRKKAKEYGITGFSTMGKSDLITNIYYIRIRKTGYDVRRIRIFKRK